MGVGVDLAGKGWIASPQPIGDGLAKRRNAPDRRIAAELAHMALKHRPEKGWDERVRLAERKVDRRRSGRDAVQQLGQAREGRGDQIVEMGEVSVDRHGSGVTG